MTRSSPAEHADKVLVTVIVPVFNTRPKLIERAVVSALAQTHADLELLIVDDGSMKEVADFLDRCAKGDRRIRVVHQTNGGVSAARNRGVELALGAFVAYLDADDYLEPGFISAALTVALTSNADAVFGGMRVLHRGGAVQWRAGGPSAREPLQSSPETTVAACVSALSDSPSTSQPTHVLSVTNVLSCLYTADIARRHRFPEGVSHAEDRLHNVHVLLDATCVAFCSDVWYVYDATDDQGATRRATPRTITDLARTVRELAAEEELIGGRAELSNDGHQSIARAAAEGVLNYLKLLSGVMAAVGVRRTNRALLRQLLTETSVTAAIKRATPSGWQSQIFATAASRRQTDLLLFLGWLWVRTRGLHMSVESPASNFMRSKKPND